MGERLPYKQDVIGSSPIVSTKPRIRAHLASFLHVSDFGHLRFSKRVRTHIRKPASIAVGLRQIFV